MNAREWMFSKEILRNVWKGDFHVQKKPVSHPIDIIVKKLVAVDIE